MSSAPTPIRIATPWRCLFASLYDALVLLALCFLAMAIITPFFNSHDMTQRLLAGLYLLAVIVAFYLWFWTHGGQTIGMRAWRLQLLTHEGQPIRPAQGLLRLGTALPPWLGLGIALLLASVSAEKLPPSFRGLHAYALWLCLLCLLWILWHNRAAGWRSRLTRTEVRLLPAKNKAA
ncbi:MAG: RDD family protein [Gammaproteobacteria bacterium]